MEQNFVNSKRLEIVPIEREVFGAAVLKTPFGTQALPNLSNSIFLKN
jgi:hypothetical protein